jgi:hypothetical protein
MLQNVLAQAIFSGCESKLFVSQLVIAYLSYRQNIEWHSCVKDRALVSKNGWWVDTVTPFEISVVVVY